ncbi:hypothetical protein GCM10010983_36310 [Caulobacter rhizosphaerae]|nr:hypothetical protein GCM10010983_36310 [Caulobacter rhizosphaerae]
MESIQRRGLGLSLQVGFDTLPERIGKPALQQEHVQVGMIDAAAHRRFHNCRTMLQYDGLEIQSGNFVRKVPDHQFGLKARGGRLLGEVQRVTARDD